MEINLFIYVMKNYIIQLLKKINIRDIVYPIVIILLLGALSFSVNKCSQHKDQYRNNIEALNDTIKYFKSKEGDLVATKLAFESDVKTLKLLNENLYNEIEDLKIKNKVKEVVYVNGIIDNPEQDTTYIIQHDTITRGFYHPFNFNNQYRILEGNVQYKDDSLGVKIEKDQIMFDYTVAMDKDNKIYIKSTNPYVKYNEISGFTIPREKRKRWSLGPAVNFGYDPIQNKPSMSVGISLNYGLLQW